MKQKLLYRKSRCKCKSFRCINGCEKNAVKENDGSSPGIKPFNYSQSESDNSPVYFNRNICNKCNDFKCVEHCYNEALSVCGEYMGLDEIMQIIKRDMAYWGVGGGVTLGGGDPLFQYGFTRELLECFQKSYIHTAIETSAFAPKDAFLEMMNYVEWAFIDIKHMDCIKHREKTGVDNTIILENITALRKSRWKGIMMIRMPVVPGFNDDPENIKSISDFLKRLELNSINILPFHRLGESKYRSLGLDYKYSDTLPPSSHVMNSIKSMFENESINCYNGFDTPF